MRIKSLRPSKGQGGYALLMVMIFLAVTMILLAGTLGRSFTSSKIDDRNNAYNAAGHAAEAATEKVVARMITDYQIDAESRVSNNLSSYRAGVPTASESPYWANFQFSDAQGNIGKTYVAKISTGANPSFEALQSQYSGLSGFSSTYRIISNVRPVNSAHNVTAAVQQDVQLAEIPIFQFAIFYNSLLEFTWAAPFTVRGRVHANANIFVGSASDLAFKDYVTTTGNILKTNWFGKSQSDYTGKITYTPATNGYGTGESALTLPVGTNNTPDAVREIINPPPTGEDPYSAMGQQRFYNKAGLVIMVSNNAVNITVKGSAADAAPITVPWTNATAFLSTNASFTDARENKVIKATELNVGNLTKWITTNTDVGKKFNSSNPLGIVYVADYRTTNSSTLTAVRLKNGADLPNTGLTVATPNPMYILGNYNNTNSSYNNTTNTSASAPASLISDALTILSGKWDDDNSTKGLSNRDAQNTTVNAAIITGDVPSTGSGVDTFSGGVQNLPRLLEDWGNGGSIKLTLNTSLINLYHSKWATGKFVAPGTYYYAPTRDFNFDQNFLNPAKLPPGTPRIRRLVRSVWCNPQPGVITYNFTNYAGQ